MHPAWFWGHTCLREEKASSALQYPPSYSCPLLQELPLTHPWASLLLVLSAPALAPGWSPYCPLIQCAMHQSVSLQVTREPTANMLSSGWVISFCVSILSWLALPLYCEHPAQGSIPPALFSHGVGK